MQFSHWIILCINWIDWIVDPSWSLNSLFKKKKKKTLEGNIWTDISLWNNVSFYIADIMHIFTVCSSFNLANTEYIISIFQCGVFFSLPVWTKAANRRFLSLHLSAPSRSWKPLYVWVKNFFFFSFFFKSFDVKLDCFSTVK